MAVYLIGFALSAALIALAQKRRTWVFVLLSVLALLIPCLIAALRAQHIGTDTMVYAKPMTEAAIVADGWGDYYGSYWYQVWRNMYVRDFEPGFTALVYVVAKLFRNLSSVLFVLQALTVVPIYLALCRDRKQFPVWLGMLVYYLLFFNSTLNMMRQWVAMAFLILAMTRLLDKKMVSTGILTLCACLFHTSALIAVPIYAVYWVVWLPRKTLLVHNNLRIGGSALTAGLFFLVGIVAILNLGLIIRLLGAVGLSRFSGYLKGEEMALMANQIIMRLPLLGILAIGWKDLRAKDYPAPFFLATLLLDMVAAQLVSVDVNAIRVGLYFSMYTVLWAPALFRACRSTPKRVLIAGLLIGYCLFYWYFTYVLNLRHATYPYAFAGL